MTKKTFYDVLQVSRNADPETIKAAYKSLVQRYHPDRNPDNPDAEKYLKEINRAYEVLFDPVKRAGYDAAFADDEDQTASHKDSSGFSSGAAQPENGANTKKAAPIDRSTTTAKKRSYIWMLDILPALAVAEFFKSLVATGFHGSPGAHSWAVFFSMLLGGGVGFPLSKYIRTKITQNMQNRRTAFIASLSVSLGLMLAIVTMTALLSKSTSHSVQNTAALPSLDLTEFGGKPPQLDLTEFAQPASPGTVNPYNDPNLGISTLPPSAVGNITTSDAEFSGQSSFKITLHNNNPDWVVTNLLIILSETRGEAGTVIPASITPPEGTVGTAFEMKKMIAPYDQSTIFLNLYPNKAYKLWLSDVKGYRH